MWDWRLGIGDWGLESGDLGFGFWSWDSGFQTRVSGFGLTFRGKTLDASSGGSSQEGGLSRPLSFERPISSEGPFSFPVSFSGAGASASHLFFYQFGVQGLGFEGRGVEVEHVVVQGTRDRSVLRVLGLGFGV